jgi:hypothetical protein
VIPIQINICRDLSDEDIANIFEDIKIKIGTRMTYELSPREHAEINKIKKAIAEKEIAVREERERQRAQKEKDERQKEHEEMVR